MRTQSNWCDRGNLSSGGQAGKSLSYDANGNLTAMGSSAYGWNVRDQLISTSDGNATFSYDAVGRRVGSTISGASSTYQYDGLNPVMVNGSLMLGGLGLDQHFGRINSGGVTSFLTDDQGSTLELTNSSAATSATYAYGPYGNASASGSDSTPFQYTGRENDGATNLYYYRARYYNPTIGRFISSDPLVLGGGINPYAYVRGNPISLIDPFGLAPTKAQCAALQKLVAYDSEQRSPLGTLYLSDYNTLSFSDNMLALDTSFDSIGGPVNVDWMLRVSAGGLGWVPGMSMGFYGGGKIVWNLMNLNAPWTNLTAPQNANAPTAALYWLQNGIPLADIFAPALKQCNCQH